jgi:hypothetical protein
MLIALLLATPLVVGGFIVWLGMGRPTPAEFWDRPTCWLTGSHDLLGPMWETQVEYGGRLWKGSVQRCSRHPATLVTVLTEVL